MYFASHRCRHVEATTLLQVTQSVAEEIPVCLPIVIGWRCQERVMSKKQTRKGAPSSTIRGWAPESLAHCWQAFPQRFVTKNIPKPLGQPTAIFRFDLVDFGKRI